MKISPHSVAFTVLLAGLSALPPLGIDMTLPALAVLARDLGTTPATAQLTLSMFLAGFAISQLVFGSLGDRFGRRPILILGITLFVATCFSNAAAPSIGVILGGALFGGIGAGACMTLARTVVRDLFSGHEALAKLSYVGMVSNLAPLTAPAIGAAMLLLFGWRAIYVLQGCLSLILAAAVVFGLAETMAPGTAQPLKPRRMMANAVRFLSHRVCGGYVLVNACVFGMLFAYISSSPVVFTGTFGVSPTQFAGLFALAAFGIMCGAFTNTRLARRVAARQLAAAGLAAIAIGGGGAFALAVTGTAALLWLMPLLFVATYGAGMMFPVSMQGALQPMPDIAGLASGIFGALQMLGGAVASAVAAALTSGLGDPLLAMSGTMALFAAAALAAFAVLVHPALRPGAAEAVENAGIS